MQHIVGPQSAGNLTVIGESGGWDGGGGGGITELNMRAGVYAGA